MTLQTKNTLVLLLVPVFFNVGRHVKKNVNTPCWCRVCTENIFYLHNEVTGRNLAISRLMRLAGIDIQHPMRPPTLSRTYMSFLKLTHKQLQPNDAPLTRARCNNYSDNIDHDQHLANYVVVLLLCKHWACTVDRATSRNDAGRDVLYALKGWARHFVRALSSLLSDYVS